MCGIFGLKPTTGRLSIQGLLPLAPSMDCPGPMASTAADLRLLFGVMAGEPSEEIPERGPFRVGVPGGFYAEHLHPEVRASVEATAGILAGAGVEVRDVHDSPRLDAAGGPRWVWTRTCYPEFARAHLGIDRAKVAPSVVDWMERGEAFPAGELAEAARGREAIRSWFGSRLDGVDALLIPSTPYAAPAADQTAVDLGPAGVVDIERVGPGWFTCGLNLAGLPGVSLPAGRSAEGLPFGVTLAGREGAEETLLRLAAVWERATGYRVERPPGPSGP